MTSLCLQTSISQQLAWQLEHFSLMGWKIRIASIYFGLDGGVECFRGYDVKAYDLIRMAGPALQQHPFGFLLYRLPTRCSIILRPDQGFRLCLLFLLYIFYNLL